MIRLPYSVGVPDFMSRCVTVSLQFLALANLLIANPPTCTEARSVVGGRQADKLSKDLPECSVSSYLTVQEISFIESVVNSSSSRAFCTFRCCMYSVGVRPVVFRNRRKKVLCPNFALSAITGPSFTRTLPFRFTATIVLARMSPRAFDKIGGDRA
jgi:hypothetical protein